ncbi:sigma-54 interaction domain-containing protein [Geosporobacter ferrireducens]|uniref:Sigma-54-dependent Fis family transcriptional regulator n=1 Tax=Geosporobacter ferrireducens TaxID=1424294 RepID=A0A1D8GIL3_9FIRM|nr:sigma 54-interacting transcriptional regulator [Geosporobacter ferrireducens]AOT70756.1 hypothetical protein Gferi_14940 [Geosporobacter ferrireducens]
MGTLNIERILNMYNYFDGAIITDEKGVILYYSNFRTDLYDLKLKEIVGKTILEIHPEMKEEDSSIMKVLKDGVPIYDHIETLTTPHGQEITNIYSTLPIIQNGKIIGAIDLSRCIAEGNQRKNIVLPKYEVDGSENLYHANDIITTSSKMKGIKQLIPRIANTDSSVLIYGETGTGKELIAQSIHTGGNRISKKFISQNCAAIPTTLLESILFGTVKGSYTGAEDRPGLFESANGGTLFLDEINSMDMVMQVKILKAIEEKKITRIGDNKPIYVDVKIISAVNEDPYGCVKLKKLREDLFYRLNTVQIDIPPLRERIADISYLTDYFIAVYNSKMNKNVLGVTEEVKEIFEYYNWPGNVRELRNIIEGAFNIIGSRFIQKENLPQYLISRYDRESERLEACNRNLSLAEKVELYEKRLIMAALDSSPSVTAAADKLKISKQALNYKLTKYGLKG